MRFIKRVNLSSFCKKNLGCSSSCLDEHLFNASMPFSPALFDNIKSVSKSNNDIENVDQNKVYEDSDSGRLSQHQVEPTYNVLQYFISEKILSPNRSTFDPGIYANDINFNINTPMDDTSTGFLNLGYELSCISEIQFKPTKFICVSPVKMCN